MITNVTNGNTVAHWVNQKQTLETQLAWELLEIFNSEPGLIGPLREMATQAFNEFKELKRTSPAASAAITQAWQSQIRIVSLARKFPAGFNSITVDSLDAQDCSDLIRLYGEFIEKAGALRARGAAGPAGDYALQDEIKSSYRVGADRWATEKKGADVGQGYGRLRTQVSAGTQSTSDAHSFLISMGGGAARFQLTDASTVSRIDHVFGLVPLADISGTTTDSIYFTERFAGPTAQDKVFYLLPLATIVGPAHHSLLEVALSLSINRIVDYRIGFYTTLLPAGAARGAERIRAALVLAEASPMNRRMLVHFSAPNLPSGCFLYEGEHLWGFKNFANCVEILDTFPWMSAWPNQAELRDFCRARLLRTA